jgi:hypothetical protein
MRKAATGSGIVLSRRVAVPPFPLQSLSPCPFRLLASLATMSVLSALTTEAFLLYHESEETACNL